MHSCSVSAYFMQSTYTFMLSWGISVVKYEVDVRCNHASFLVVTYTRQMSFTISVTGTPSPHETSPLGNSFVFIWLDVRGICLADMGLRDRQGYLS